MAQQSGLLTRVQALDLGLSPNGIQALLRSNEWVWVRRGAYCDGEVWHAADPYRGRPLLRARAAVLLMRRDWVLSHDSSAHAHELDILPPDEPFVHVTRRASPTRGPRPASSTTWPGSGPSRWWSWPACAPWTWPARWSTSPASADISTVSSPPTPHSGWACRGPSSSPPTSHMANWPGITDVRTAVALADPRAQTVLESLGRDFVISLGIGVPDPQFPVQLPRGVVWGDIRVGNHLFECDGLLKYRPAAEGGVAVRPVEKVVADQIEREGLLRAEGLGVTRLTYADFFGDRRLEAEQRCLRDWRDTVDRHGTELHEHLARNAAEIRSRRSRPFGA